jgi:hypothetical protein
MADESNKGSESVDENGEDLGVEEQESPEESGKDAMAVVGGVFDVPTSKKRKKKKKAEKKAEESADDSNDESADEEDAEVAGEDDSKVAEETESSSKPKPKKSSKDNVAGVFNTSGDDDIDLDDLGGDYLDEYDLGGHKKGMSTTNVVLIGVVLLLVAALGGVVVQFTDLGGDFMALMRGELREKKLAEVAQEEAAWEAKQLAAMEKYGTLNVTGSPMYALVKLDGQIQYGQTSSGAWRELRLTSVGGTIFRNLKVKEKHTIEVSAPGFITDSVELTEGMWQGGEGPYSYTKRVALNLLAESGQRQLEFEQRMDTSDTENEYFGTVSITTMPAGSLVFFDNHVALNEDGTPFLTPVTFDKYYIRDAETGELEEKKIYVDTPPDVGHKIELVIPSEDPEVVVARIEAAEKKAAEKKAAAEKAAEKKVAKKAAGKKAADKKAAGEKEADEKIATEYPTYVSALQRRMWTCEWKDGTAPDAPPEGKSFRDLCNYTFSLEMDFNSLKTYIERRKAERERVKAENAKLQAALEKKAGGEAAAE